MKGPLACHLCDDGGGGEEGEENECRASRAMAMATKTVGTLDSAAPKPETDSRHIAQQLPAAMPGLRPILHTRLLELLLNNSHVHTTESTFMSLPPRCVLYTNRISVVSRLHTYLAYSHTAKDLEDEQGSIVTVRIKRCSRIVKVAKLTMISDLRVFQRVQSALLVIYCGDGRTDSDTQQPTFTVPTPWTLF